MRSKTFDLKSLEYQYTHISLFDLSEWNNLGLLVQVVAMYIFLLAFE